MSLLKDKITYSLSYKYKLQLEGNKTHHCSIQCNFEFCFSEVWYGMTGGILMLTFRMILNVKKSPIWLNNVIYTNTYLSFANVG